MLIVLEQAIREPKRYSPGSIDMQSPLPYFNHKSIFTTFFFHTMRCSLYYALLIITETNLLHKKQFLGTIAIQKLPFGDKKLSILAK